MALRTAMAVAVLWVVAGPAQAAVTPISTFSKSGRDAVSGSTATAGGPAGATAAGHTIDWVLHYVNNTAATADVDIRDVITGNQEFVPGSLDVPPGLTAGWSTNGGGTFAGTEPAAGVNAVRASGASVGGSTGAQVLSQPGPQGFAAIQGGGDGWEALFVGDAIYNIHHHSGGGNATQIDCHLRSTGTRCPGAYPRYVSSVAGAPFGTGGNDLITAHDTDAIVAGTRIYYPAGRIGTRDVGVACADVATQTSCGFTQLATSASVNAGISAHVNGGVDIGTRLYLVSDLAEILCFDTATQAACAGFPLVDVADPGAGTLRWPHYSLDAFDDRYLFGTLARANAQRDLTCIDLTTNARCSGFPKVNYTTAGSSYNGTLAPILDTTGDVIGICGVDAPNTAQHPFECFELDGDPTPTPFSTTQVPNTSLNWVNFGRIETIGTRMYFAETSGTVATYTCWDFATAQPCEHFVPASTGAAVATYTLRQDPQNPDCIWQLGHTARFEVFSATFGGTSCSAAQATLDLRPSDNYCDGPGGHVTGWDRLSISGVAPADYSGLAVTITDADGDPVPGWTGRVFSNTTTSIDISGIPASGSTSALRFVVSVAGLAPDRTATITATYVGDPVQVCFSTRVGQAECSATQPITNGATAVTDAGLAGSDAPLGNPSGTVTFEQAADPSLCRADLAMEKTGTPKPVTPGQNLTYTLRVTNNGPDAARDVVVSDPIPAGLGFVSASDGCSAGGGTVTCALGTLPNGESRTVEVVLRVPPSQSGEIVNTATVDSPVDDPDPDNDSDTERVPVTPVADVAIAKAVEDPSPVLGDTITYTLTVTNHGPTPAEGVTVSDAAAAAIVPISAVPSQGACSSPTSCELGTLGVGAIATITLRARAAAEGAAGNTATASSATLDLVPANNTASAAVEVRPEADVSIVKTASDTRVNEGEDFTYRLVVANRGPSVARDVTVTDSLPAGVALRSVSTTRGTCADADPVVCRLGDLAADEEVRITVAVTATEPGEPENTATAISTTPDPDPANNQDGTRVTTDREADLAIVKDASAAVVASGEAFDWRLQVVNRGPSRAAGVVVTDTVPDGLTIVSVSAPGGACTVAGQVVTCALGTLARDATARITVSVRTRRAGFYTNSAGVTSETRDPNPENNLDEAVVTASARADVAIAKSAPTGVAAVGETVAYAVTVTNRGPDDAANVTVTDPLPPGATFVSATPSAGDCQVAVGVLTCDLGTLPDGMSVSIELRVTLTQTGEARNVAQVTATTPDPDPANNQAETARTGATADISLRKEASTLRPPAGRAVTYSLIVSNAGPVAARGVIVTDPIPESLQYVDASTSAGACARVQSGVVCNVGDLEPGASATVTVRAIALRVGDAANTASAVATTPSDPTPENNVASAVVTSPRPRLALRKTASSRTVRAGGRISFRLRVRNRGGSTAHGVRVCDRLPAGLAFVRSTRPSRVVAGSRCWKVGRLRPGTQRIIGVTARALRGASGRRVNRATAGGRDARPVAAAVAVRVRGGRVAGGGVTG